MFKSHTLLRSNFSEHLKACSSLIRFSKCLSYVSFWTYESLFNSEYLFQSVYLMSTVEYFKADSSLNIPSKCVSYVCCWTFQSLFKSEYIFKVSISCQLLNISKLVQVWIYFRSVYLMSTVEHFKAYSSLKIPI